MNTHGQVASVIQIHQNPDNELEQKIKHSISQAHRGGRQLITGDLIRHGKLHASVTLMENKTFHGDNLKTLLEKAQKRDIIAIG